MRCCLLVWEMINMLDSYRRSNFRMEHLWVNSRSQNLRFHIALLQESSFCDEISKLAKFRSLGLRDYRASTDGKFRATPLRVAQPFLALKRHRGECARCKRAAAALPRCFEFKLQDAEFPLRCLLCLPVARDCGSASFCASRRKTLEFFLLLERYTGAQQASR